MRDYELSAKEITKLERTHRSLRDKRQADRVKAVIALAKGWSAVQSAEILLFDEKTSRHYFDRYQQGGMDALLDDNYSGAEPKLDEHQMSELEDYLEEHILPDAQSVIGYITKQYAVRYSVRATDLCPVLKRQIGCEYQALSFIGSADHLKEQFRAGLAEGHIAKFIEDQQVLFF